MSFAEKARERLETPPKRDFAGRARSEAVAKETSLRGKDLALSIAKSATGQETLEGPGLTFSERARISFLGDTPSEKQAAFEQQFPQGEYLPVPNTDVTLFRRNREEPFQIADPSISDAFHEGRLASETVRDMGDFVGDIPELVGEAALTLFGRGRGKGAFQASRPWLEDLARLFAGGAGGSQAQQAVQSAAGTQKQTGMEQIEQSVGEGALSVVGGTVGDIIGRGINVAKGGGFLARTPEGVEAQKAAEDLGIEGSLPVGAVTDNPVVRLLAKQSGSLTTQIGRELRKFNTELLDRLSRGANPAELKRFTKRGHALLREQNNSMLRTVNDALSNPKASVAEVAPLLQRSVNHWWHNTSKRAVDNLYETARSIEDPKFDIAGLQNRVQEIIRRPTAAGREGEEIAFGELNPAAKQVSDKIMALDPDQPVSLDTLRAARQELWDASLPGPGGERMLDSQARALRGAIDRVVKNPQNSNPDFLAAWREADKAALERFNTRELMAVSQMINTDRPAQALKTILNQGFEAVAELNRALKPSQFRVLQRAFQADMIRNPQDVVETLNRFDPEMKRMFLSEDMEKAIKRYGEAYQRLDKTKLAEALETQSNVRNQISTILSSSDSRSFDDLRKIIRDRGGMKSPFGKSVRAAIMDEVFNRASDVTDKGAKVIDARSYQNVIRDFKKSGAFKMLPLEDQLFLNDIEKVRNVLGTAGDAGTALRAAQAASGLAELEGSAIGELIESMSIGRILTKEAGKRFLTGTARGKPIDLSTARAMGGMISTIANDVEQD